MTRRDKDINRILDARNDANIDFELLRSVLLRLGWTVSVRGSHFKFTKLGTQTQLTLSAHSKRAAAYQVRQVRRAILDVEDLEPEE